MVAYLGKAHEPYCFLHSIDLSKSFFNILILSSQLFVAEASKDSASKFHVRQPICSILGFVNTGYTFGVPFWHFINMFKCRYMHKFCVVFKINLFF